MKIGATHLTYCSNIHPGESWADHFQSLKDNVPLIKKEVSDFAPFGIGLRLSNIASVDLQTAGELEELRKWLKQNNAYVFTMNGFPYGNFHNAVVKDQVHSPDWTTKERLNYTLRLFEILAELVPEGMDGGVSTSPLSYRFWYHSEDEKLKAQNEATLNIVSVVERLFLFGKKKGVKMHLDIEPEPDGLLETGAEFIEWYQSALLPTAKRILPSRLSITEDEVADAVREHICLCYDVCHFAIGYELHQKVLEELHQNKIRIGKIQISAALKSDLPAKYSEREALARAFSEFEEPTYLHQVVGRKKDHELIRYRDLPDALADIHNPEVDEWRAHFHVPVFLKDMSLLGSTQADILEVLDTQKARLFTSHLEVETYTWEVLPESLKVPVDQSISRELNWVKGILKSKGQRNE